MLGLEPDCDAHALDLGGERGERLLRLEPGPQGSGIARLEPADALDPKLEPAGADLAQGDGDVFRNRPLDLADEAQGQMQLLVLLPAEIGAVVHRVYEQVADRLGGADGDEQAVH